MNSGFSRCRTEYAPCANSHSNQLWSVGRCDDTRCCHVPPVVEADEDAEHHIGSDGQQVGAGRAASGPPCRPDLGRVGVGHGIQRGVYHRHSHDAPSYRRGCVAFAGPVRPRPVCRGHLRPRPATKGRSLSIIELGEVRDEPASVPPARRPRAAGRPTRAAAVLLLTLVLLAAAAPGATADGDVGADLAGRLGLPHRGRHRRRRRGDTHRGPVPDRLHPTRANDEGGVRRRWRTSLGRSGDYVAVWAEGGLLLAVGTSTASSVLETTAFDAATGRRLWHQPGVTQRTADDGLLLMDDSGEGLAIGPRAGARHRRRPLDRAGGQRPRLPRSTHRVDQVRARPADRRIAGVRRRHRRSAAQRRHAAR